MTLAVVKNNNVTANNYRYSTMQLTACSKINHLLNISISYLTHSTSLIILAILLGSSIGFFWPNIGDAAGNFTDTTILILVFLLLFEVPLKGIFLGLSKWKFIAVAWLTNFAVIPAVGFVIASLFLSGQPLFYTGLVIYFMAPCTDWYLGFTRMAKGNVELGAALLPINMLSQLMLFPVYLLLFDTVVDYRVDLTVLVDWFLHPLMAAIILRVLLYKVMKTLLPLCRLIIPLVLALLVGQIFASNINVLMGNLAVVPRLLLAIFTFFVMTYFIGDYIARFFKFEYPEHCLLSFTTGARNAPLMLGLTTVAIPDQPLIYATITIGMLIEFPHLTALKLVLLKRIQGNYTPAKIGNQVSQN